ncbi:uncharacterized protein LOC133314155 [Gastrolobium bilobum]|uniref:uncharacterized protein LOC133314155 n=1 Tax=Gastrolobium bilobum TaxID=150636 RepID=UPI002AB29158|nr:uncharacterized protein LOC133314155 [Gastrolobium bilobum]
MAPELVETREAVRSSECEDSELEKLESDLKPMAHKILDYRSTLPDQLKTTLLSVLDAQRPFLPQLNSTQEQNISGEESSSAPEDPETAKKLKLLNEKISSNCSAMPIVLKRMKDCIAKIEKLDSYNAAIIHPAFKRKKTG